MAVLDTHTEAARRGPWRRRLVLLVLLFFVSCMILDQTVLEEDSGPAFSHSFHVTEQGLNCLVCHKSTEDRDLPGLPAQDLCMICHKNEDKGKPPERSALAFFVDGVHQPLDVLGFDEEVVFSHKGHLDWVGDCNACHTNIENSERLGPDDQILMDTCVDCHAERQAPNTCATCHQTIDENWRPPSHMSLWDEVHGAVSRNPQCMQDQCSLCHTESNCTSCHLGEKPASHTNFFRLKGHGIVAAMDRTTCQTCHQDDSCTACHDATRPMSHKGMFGQRRNTHCLSCHEPLRNETTCLVCHKGTPSHGDATPLPSNHSPAFNCRQCHGAGAPLPHVDNGSACTSCHLP
jgi:hypothetical protein